jgi:hypothetical protein
MDAHLQARLGEAAKDPVLAELLAALLDNPDQKRVMLGILDLEPVRRGLVLRELIKGMGPKGAAPEFIRAWSFLLQDEVAEAARKALKDAP